MEKMYDDSNCPSEIELQEMKTKLLTELEKILLKDGNDSLVF